MIKRTLNILIILLIILLSINFFPSKLLENLLSPIPNYIKTIDSSERLSQVATVLKINDGDTITVKINGIIEHIRLIGIDAPESYQNDRTNREAQRTGQSVKSIIRLGKNSSKYLQNILSKGDKVYLEFDIDKRDRFNRLLAYVYLEDKTLLNEKILRDGYALPYTVSPNIKYAPKLLKAYKKARQENIGLMSD